MATQKKEKTGVVKKAPEVKMAKAPRKKKEVKKEPGRPSLYEEKKDLILQVLREGNYQVTAAKVAGICPQTLSEWKTTFPEFAEAIKAAEAEAEISALQMVRAHSAGNWQAAAWYLERKFPERFGKVDRLQIDKVENEVKEMSDDELIAFIRRSGNEGTGPTE